MPSDDVAVHVTDATCESLAMPVAADHEESVLGDCCFALARDPLIGLCFRDVRKIGDSLDTGLAVPALGYPGAPDDFF